MPNTVLGLSITTNNRLAPSIRDRIPSIRDRIPSIRDRIPSIRDFDKFQAIDLNRKKYDFRDLNLIKTK